METLWSQTNLVPNGSFEQISDCPNQYKSVNVDLAYGWYAPFKLAQLFNACDTGAFGVPTNRYGCYKFAKEGVGYAGIITGVVNSARTSYYLGVTLSEPLRKNKKYFIRLYAAFSNCNWHPCACDALGLGFFHERYIKDTVFSTSEILPSIKPVVSNPAGHILNDTVNWMEVSGCYIANGTETDAIIGGFKWSKDIVFDTSCLEISTGSYYYIDDVGIYLADLVPDTVLYCGNGKMKLGHTFLDGTFKWSTGEQDSVIWIDQAGTYSVECRVGSCTISDTVVVIGEREIDSLNPIQALICEGEVYNYLFPDIGEFKWSDGSDKNYLSTTKAGEYEVKIKTPCKDLNYRFELDTKVCNCNVYFPNVFSPNGDGVNDYFRPSFHCDFPVTSVRFAIYNRWGAEQYSINGSRLSDISWDGSFKSKPAASGVYVWQLQYTYQGADGLSVVNKKGDVTLLR